MRKHFSLLKTEDGLSSLQMILLGVVAAVMLSAVWYVFASGGATQVVNQFESTEQSVADCMYNSQECGEAVAGAMQVGAAGVQPNSTVPIENVSWWDQAWEDVKSGVSEVWNTVTDWVKTGVESVSAWWESTPGWFKGLVAGLVAAAVIVVGVVVAVVAGVPITAALIVATAVAAVAAIAAGIWHGLTHVDFSFPKALITSLGVGIIAFVSTYLVAANWATIAGWLTKTAWPAIQKAALQVGNWMSNTAWPAIKSAALRVWAWLANGNAGKSASDVIKSILGHWGAYIIAKIGIVDLLINHHLEPFSHYAIDLALIALGVKYIPSFLKSGIFGRAFGGGIVARFTKGIFGATVWTTIRSFLGNLVKDGPEWKDVPAALLSGFSRLVVGNVFKPLGAFFGSFGERFTRIFIKEGAKNASDIDLLPSATPLEHPPEPPPTPPSNTATPSATPTPSSQRRSPQPAPATPTPPPAPIPTPAAPATTPTPIAPAQKPVHPYHNLDAQPALRLDEPSLGRKANFQDLAAVIEQQYRINNPGAAGLHDGKEWAPGDDPAVAIIKINENDYLVSIAGTDADGDGLVGANDWPANLSSGRGVPSTYQLYVKSLIEDMVPEGATIRLMGHSQGAHVAMNLADDQSLVDRYTIGSVITFGAPGSAPYNERVGKENYYNFLLENDPIRLIDGDKAGPAAAGAGWLLGGPAGAVLLGSSVSGGISPAVEPEMLPKVTNDRIPYATDTPLGGSLASPHSEYIFSPELAQRRLPFEIHQWDAQYFGASDDDLAQYGLGMDKTRAGVQDITEGLSHSWESVKSMDPLGVLGGLGRAVSGGVEVALHQAAVTINAGAHHVVGAVTQFMPDNWRTSIDRGFDSIGEGIARVPRLSLYEGWKYLFNSDAPTPQNEAIHPTPVPVPTPHSPTPLPNVTPTPPTTSPSESVSSPLSAPAPTPTHPSPVPHPNSTPRQMSSRTSPARSIFTPTPAFSPTTP